MNKDFLSVNFQKIKEKLYLALELNNQVLCQSKEVESQVNKIFINNY